MAFYFFISLPLSFSFPFPPFIYSQIFEYLLSIGILLVSGYTEVSMGFKEQIQLQ